MDRAVRNSWKYSPRSYKEFLSYHTNILFYINIHNNIKNCEPAVRKLIIFLNSVIKSYIKTYKLTH